MGTLAKANQRCLDCGSSDGMAIYATGDAWCFSCSKYFTSEQVEGETGFIGEQRGDNVVEIKQSEFLTGSFKPLTGENILNRGISKQACERFGVVVTDDGKIVLPYCNQKGNPCAQKVRATFAPKGFWIGSAKEATFFGAQLWKTGKKLLVTEGELDALAAWMMAGDYPVISVRNGGDKEGEKIANEIRENYDYFKGFEEVILCFDNDEVGRISAEVAAKVLPAGKAKIMSLSKHKDANDYLKAGDGDLFKKEFWAAPLYAPSGIIAGTDTWDLVKSEELFETVPYPYQGMTDFTFGLRPKEVVLVVSGSGTGKSQFLREISHFLLEVTPDPMGFLMMEETPQKTALGMMSLLANVPLHLVTAAKSLLKFYEKNPKQAVRMAATVDKMKKQALLDLSKEEKETVFGKTVGLRDKEGRPRIWFFDHFGSNDISEIIYRVEYMAKAYGCKYIFLDHISIIVSDQRNDDERKALDEITTKLRTAIQHLDTTLILVSHLKRPGSKPHEEGGQTSLADVRGTAGIGQMSDVVIGLERNGQSDDRIERNTTKVRILKNRFSGLTGLSSSLYYDPKTGRMTEIPEVNSEEEKEKE